MPLPQSVSLQDENGVNRPVCSYVRVLRAGRLLESPRQAARFVSLLAHEKAPVVGGGGGKQEQWCTLMAFLCRGKVRMKCLAPWQPQQEKTETVADLLLFTPKCLSHVFTL